KSTDGGATWKDVLKISPDTGVSDVVFDPRDPDTLYAAAYQRRRRQWTLIDGGPESAIYKSLDGGAHWRKLTNGLPSVDLGRIGLAISPASPDTVYAIIEAANGKSGFFRSEDGGGSWKKMSDYISSSPQYYQEIIADPKDPDRIYSMDTWMKVSQDGGKTFTNVGEESKHVDNHALWIDPADTNHLIAGCDGGLYESHDRGATWRFFANLPVTQFYNVAIGLDAPFYHVYGGTQDNNTLGGPARTAKENGIANSDWFVTVGGDGFASQVDPKDPDIVYSESQYGGLVRFDRKNGEAVDIQPQPAPGQPALRFNWDSPLIVSPHSHTRLYFAAQQVFRSDDRGDSWTPISPDLTRKIDRNKLKIMGKVWPVDAVAKNASTSYYGSIVALAESPVKEGLIYAGTDDGLLQVSSDGGKDWTKIDHFPGVPDMTMISDIEPSHQHAGTVYVAFDNHKSGDFAPYLLRSTDEGKTWSSIAGDLPHRGSVHAVIEDPKDPDLLFAGTEFGLFFTPDLGHHWVELKGGMPTVAVRDLVIQPQMNDLVVATFGRGFYVLDDMSPLREVNPGLLDHDETFPVRKALMYIPRTPLGDRGKAGEGDAYFLAPNPPFGAVFTYYLKDSLKTLKEQRHAKEAKELKAKAAAPYPTWKELREESQEQKPSVIAVVSDSEGHVIRRIEGPVKAGFHRIAWDLRYPPSTPITTLEPKEPGRYDASPTGPMVVPGTYQVSLYERIQGKETPLGSARTFSAEAIGTSSLPKTDRAALLAFENKTAKLERAVLGAASAAKDANHHLALVERALLQ
ncbi:MAG TPA: glycosyl hydrolase, partial [Thermoanaerobaculia bacterium]|nr:glycosyl hydrolase [Thermoanaerobaculia bacterium]